MATRQTNTDTKSEKKKATTSSAPKDAKEVISNEGESAKKECWFSKVYNKNPNTVTLSILGLVIALCFIIIGFWGTILIILLTGTGFVYGQYKDKALWVYYMMKKMLK